MISSSCSPLGPNNVVEPLLCRDGGVVADDDDDAVLIDFISSISALSKPSFIFDARRDKLTSSARITCRSLTNSSVIFQQKNAKFKFCKFNLILSVINPLFLRIGISEDGMSNSLLRHFKYKARS